MNFILIFVNVLYYIGQSVYAESSLCPWNEPHLIMMYCFLLYCYCIVFNLLVFCLGFLHLYSSEIPVCSFCVYVILSRFWYQGYVGLLKCIRKYCLSNFFERNRYQNSLNALQNSLGKPSGPGLLFWGRFLMVVLISSLLISVFRFSSA